MDGKKRVWLSERTVKLCSVFFSVIVLSGCVLTLISKYDEQTDKAVMALHDKVEGFLLKLEDSDRSPECSYESNKSFYNDARVAVSAIQVRAAAVPQNDITIEQAELLSKNLLLLEQLHKGKAKKEKGKDCLSREEIAPLRNAFNSGFTAIIKLELAKKRNESK